MSIRLDPSGNQHFLSISNHLLLSADECNELIATLDPDLWQTAAITYEDRPGGQIQPDVRSVVEQRLPVRADGWPVRAIVDRIVELNSELWRYDITGFTTDDYPSVLMYEAGAGDHFRPHTDAGPFSATRKLSFSIQLSEASAYRGGDLAFQSEGVVASRDRGHMIVFPSLMSHEVTPVFSGTRLAIVGWVHGPTFR